ncbi:MAG: pyridoxamine 5'-phosphate oxidase family protein [Acidimicrobiia bacterium]|nr:pyridoxamine 5'-phosphate oxidase family protein [Acidimicrobiia bacterium]NNF62650.1 pyridoxamine 5'-phosphate oxidase family protein [Acidimicrobiia bacterium]
MVDELPQERCWAELAASSVGHLALVSEGEPYVTPVSFVAKVPTISFRTGAGRRLSALRSGNRVCFEACTEDQDSKAWTSVVAWGTPRRSILPDERSEVIDELYLKYHSQREDPFRAPAPSILEPEVVIIDVDYITGRSSGLGLGARLRPGRL